MNILLDTHIALWVITDSPRLSDTARALISAPKSIVWVSVASVWEIAIKHGLGRGDMPLSGQQALTFFWQSGMGTLNVEPEHAAATSDLPHHHNDPFDRLIISQALLEPMRLITHDATVARYSDTIIRV